MPQIGPLEILIVGVIALIVFGPEKLPGILRSTGRAISELRRMATEVKTDFESGLDTDADSEPLGERLGTDDTADEPEEPEEPAPTTTSTATPESPGPDERND